VEEEGPYTLITTHTHTHRAGETKRKEEKKAGREKKTSVPHNKGGEE